MDGGYGDGLSVIRCITQIDKTMASVIFVKTGQQVQRLVYPPSLERDGWVMKTPLMTI
jgi:hypothetical protein